MPLGRIGRARITECSIRNHAIFLRGACERWAEMAEAFLTALYRQPAILFQIDEFGMFLSAAADRKCDLALNFTAPSTMISDGWLST